MQERPSDRLIELLRSAAGVPDDAMDIPVWVYAFTVLFIATSGLSISILFAQLLGNSYWSSGDACICLTIGQAFELTRPPRLSKEETLDLENQYREFKDFGYRRLTHRGVCHESEIFEAFRAEKPWYRNKAVLSDEDLRNFMARWHIFLRREPNGYVNASFWKDPGT